MMHQRPLPDDIWFSAPEQADGYAASFPAMRPDGYAAPFPATRPDGRALPSSFLTTYSDGRAMPAPIEPGLEEPFGGGAFGSSPPSGGRAPRPEDEPLPYNLGKDDPLPGLPPNVRRNHKGLALARILSGRALPVDHILAGIPEGGTLKTPHGLYRAPLSEQEVAGMTDGRGLYSPARDVSSWPLYTPARDVPGRPQNVSRSGHRAGYEQAGGTAAVYAAPFIATPVAPAVPVSPAASAAHAAPVSPAAPPLPSFFHPQSVSEEYQLDPPDARPTASTLRAAELAHAARQIPVATRAGQAAPLFGPSDDAYRPWWSNGEYELYRGGPATPGMLPALNAVPAASAAHAAPVSPAAPPRPSFFHPQSVSEEYQLDPPDVRPTAATLRAAELAHAARQIPVATRAGQAAPLFGPSDDAYRPWWSNGEYELYRGGPATPGMLPALNAVPAASAAHAAPVSPAAPPRPSFFHPQSVSEEYQLDPPDVRPTAATLRAAELAHAARQIPVATRAGQAAPPLSPAQNPYAGGSSAPGAHSEYTFSPATRTIQGAHSEYSPGTAVRGAPPVAPVRNPYADGSSVSGAHSEYTFSPATRTIQGAHSEYSPGTAVRGAPPPSPQGEPGYFRRGFDRSVTGLLLNGPSKDTLSEEDLKNMGISDELLFALGTLTGDLPTYAAGAALGSPLGPGGMMAGGAALTEGTRAALMDMHRGPYQGFGDMARRMGNTVLATAKGGATGGLIYAGGAGGAQLVGRLGGGAVSQMAASLLGEAGAATVLDAAERGELRAQNFLRNLMAMSAARTGLAAMGGRGGFPEHYASAPRGGYPLGRFTGYPSGVGIWSTEHPGASGYPAEWVGPNGSSAWSPYSARLPEGVVQKLETASKPFKTAEQTISSLNEKLGDIIYSNHKRYKAMEWAKRIGLAAEAYAVPGPPSGAGWPSLAGLLAAWAEQKYQENGTKHYIEQARQYIEQARQYMEQARQRRERSEKP